MIIAYNQKLNSWYAHKVAAGALAFCAERRDAELWLPGAPIVQQEPEKIDGIVGAYWGRGYQFAAENTPVVNFHSRFRAGSVQVCSDNVAICQMAFRHFRERGIRNFAVLHIENESTMPRGLCFAEACRERGFPAYLIPCWHQGIRRSNEALVRALFSLPKPAGLMLSRDGHGRSLIDLCQDLSIRVPDDIAILGINNNVDFCRASTPTLSSIDIDAERIGYIAARTVVEMIEGRSVPGTRVIPPVELVMRDSTDITIDQDPNLTKALDFMQAHLHEAIEVEDILRAQEFGRRALEKHFHSAFGMAPMHYLRSLRLEKAQHLLESTDMKIIQVATECGFSDSNYLCRLFRKLHQTTPLQYRKQRRV